MPAEEFKGHVATDGSLLGIAGKWEHVVGQWWKMDHDEGMGPLHGSMEGELQVQRTIRGRS